MGVATHDALAAALAAELAAAIEAGLGEPVTSAPGPVAAGDGWSAALDVSGGLVGELTLWVSGDGARAIATRLLGMDEEPEASVLADMVKELWAQAAGAASMKPAGAGLSLTVSAATTGSTDGGSGWVIAAGGDPLAHLRIVGTLTVAAGAPALPGAMKTPVAPPPRPGLRDEPDDDNLAVLLDINLPLVVRFARTDLTLKALSELGPGSVVDMGRSPEDPVEVLVGGQVVAQGEVVVVAGNYGVRITNLLSQAERLRALEA